MNNINNRSKKLPTPGYSQGSFSYEANGKIRYRKSVRGNNLSVTASTVKECYAAMKIKESLLIDNEKKRADRNPKNERLTFTQSINSWWETLGSKTSRKLTSKNRKELTLKYQICMAEFANMQVDTITEIDIQEHLDSLKSEKHLSKSTVKKAYELLGQYFDYYYASNPLNNPMNHVVMPTYEESMSSRDEDDENMILTDEEINRLVRVASMKYKTGNYIYRNGWAIIFLLFSFVRPAEAIGLKWSDYNEFDNTIRIERNISRVKNEEGQGKKYKLVTTTTKTMSSNRINPLFPEAKEALMKYKEITSPYSDDSGIFTSQSGQPLAERNLYLLFQQMLMRAEIDKRLSLYSLRHSGISYYIRHGVPIDVISRMAGHKSVSITNDVYYQRLMSQKRDAVQGYIANYKK